MKKILYLFILMSLLIGLGLPFAQPVFADTLTVYGSTSDGYISYADITYNAAWTGASGTVENTGDAFTLGQTYIPADPPYIPEAYILYRAFLFFDTSSIPSNATITLATLTFHGNSDGSDTDFLITIQNGQPTYSHDPLVAGDYSKANYSGDGGSLTTVGFNVDQNYPPYHHYPNVITLNADGRSWIQKGVGAKTKLCLRSSRDIAGTTPTGAEDVGIVSAESGGSYRPVLYVEYIVLVAPTVTTSAVTNILSTSCSGNGNITATGGTNATRRGFCYKVGTSGDPTTADSVAFDDGSFGTGVYTKSIAGLTASTNYRIRAYAINSVGTGYGSTVQVATTIGTPLVVTNAVDGIACTIATLNGSITSVGDENADMRGFVWATSTHGIPPGAPPAPYSDNWTAFGSFGVGAFDHDLATLTEGQSYYVRAFAHNSLGYSYGTEVSFTCWEDPIITTNAATSVTVSTARLQSYLNNSGGEACEVRWGYGLSDEGNIIGDYDTFTSFAGSYSTGASPYLDVSSLIANRDYYFNVEVQNSCGVDTGTSTMFHTESDVGSPSNVTAIPSYNSIVLSWVKGTGTPNTFIRRRENVCPADETDGTLVYMLTGSTYTDTALTSGVDYCYYIVGYDSVEGYSTNYIVIHATTLAAGFVTDTTGTAIVKPSGMTQTPDITAALEANIPLMPSIRAASTSTGIPMGSVLYGILLIVLTGLSYGIYRWTHSIEWIVVIWFFANWVAYPTLHTPIVVPIFVSLVGLGYAIYRVRSLI